MWIPIFREGALVSSCKRTDIQTYVRTGDWTALGRRARALTRALLGLKMGDAVWMRSDVQARPP